MAGVLKNERITAEDHFQDTRHMELDLGNSGLAYQPGSLLAVFPQQHTSALHNFLHRTGLDPDEWVRIEAADPLPGTQSAADEVPHLPVSAPITVTPLFRYWHIFWLVCGHWSSHLPLNTREVCVHIIVKHTDRSHGLSRSHLSLAKLFYMAQEGECRCWAARRG